MEQNPNQKATEMALQLLHSLLGRAAVTRNVPQSSAQPPQHHEQLAMTTELQNLLSQASATATSRSVVTPSLQPAAVPPAGPFREIAGQNQWLSDLCSDAISRAVPCTREPNTSIARNAGEENQGVLQLLLLQCLWQQHQTAQQQSHARSIQLVALLVNALVGSSQSHPLLAIPNFHEAVGTASTASPAVDDTSQPRNKLSEIGAAFAANRAPNIIEQTSRSLNQVQSTADDSSKIQQQQRENFETVQSAAEERLRQLLMLSPVPAGASAGEFPPRQEIVPDHSAWRSDKAATNVTAATLFTDLIRRRSDHGLGVFGAALQPSTQMNISRAFTGQHVGQLKEGGASSMQPIEEQQPYEYPAVEGRYQELLRTAASRRSSTEDKSFLDAMNLTRPNETGTNKISELPTTQRPTQGMMDMKSRATHSKLSPRCTLVQSEALSTSAADDHQHSSVPITETKKHTVKNNPLPDSETKVAATTTTANISIPIDYVGVSSPIMAGYVPSSNVELRNSNIDRPILTSDETKNSNATLASPAACNPDPYSQNRGIFSKEQAERVVEFLRQETPDETKQDATVEITNCERPKKRKYSHEPFPNKAFRIITKLEADGKSHIASFLDEGGLWVHDRKIFVDDIMPDYFRGNTWSSFRRQMFSHGFSSVPPSQQRKGAFTNSFFFRGRPELLGKITRDDRHDKRNKTNKNSR